MGDPIKQYQYISAPRAKAGQPGRVANIAVTVTAAVFDLTTITNPTYVDENVATSQLQGALGSYVTILADGADVGVIFGTVVGDVTGANVPALGTTGAVDGSGVYTPVAKECWVIKSGTSQSFLLKHVSALGSGNTAPWGDKFMGFVGSGNGYMRIYQSSPPGLAVP